MSRLRSSTVTLSAMFLGLIPATAACGDSQDTNVDTAEICMDEATEIRVDDSKCPPNGGSSGGYSWVYVNGHAPAVGSPVRGYSTVKTGIVGRAPIGGGKAISSGG